MSTTFKKRQKEMKRQEKQRVKAERREQKKFAKRAAGAQNALTTPPSDSGEPPQLEDKQRRTRSTQQ